MSTNNLCFHGEIRKISYFWLKKSALSGYMTLLHTMKTPFCHGRAHGHSDFHVHILLSTPSLFLPHLSHVSCFIYLVAVCKYMYV